MKKEKSAFPNNLKYGFETFSDLRFMQILAISFVFHFIIVVSVQFIKVTEQEVSEKALEQMSERFARLIVPQEIEEKKIKKVDIGKSKGEEQIEEKKTKEKEKGKGDSGPEKISKTKEKAQKAIAVRGEKVSRSVRTKGVLGIITGKGVSSRQTSYSTIDILKNIGIGGTTGRSGDLDTTLSQITGLKKGTKNGEGLGSGDFGKGSGVKGGRISGGAGTSEITDLIGSGGGPEMAKMGKKGVVKVEAPEEIKGSVEALSARTQEEIKKEVEKHKQQIMYYYNIELKRNPNLKGKITVKFIIEANGTISSCSIIKSTMIESTSLETNLEKIIKRTWKFSPINTSSGNVSIIYTFAFVAEM
ncbi:MAG: AgmX/PglI C-terminal domain-containing protein [bacterium]